MRGSQTGHIEVIKQLGKEGFKGIKNPPGACMQPGRLASVIHFIPEKLIIHGKSWLVGRA